MQANKELTALEKALKRLQEARQEKVKTFFLNIPWNIFSERHGLFLPLFFLGIVVLLAALFNLVSHVGIWTLKATAWHAGMLFLYVPFLLSLCFFKKGSAFLTAGALFIATFLLAGFYPLNHFLRQAVQQAPLLNLLPLSEAPEQIVPLWQFLYNLLLVPVTALALLFHRSLEIYFNEDMKDELRELLGKSAPEPKMAEVKMLPAPRYEEDEEDD